MILSKRRMRFKLKEPIAMLLSQKKVATIRPYYLKPMTVVKIIPINKYGVVEKCLLYSDYTAAILIKYSGFPSLRHWKEAYAKVKGRPPDTSKDYIIVLRLLE